MRRIEGVVVCSATDLVNYLECEHLSALDRMHLDAPMEKAEDGDVARLIQEHGMRHEGAYLASLRSAGKSVVDVSQPSTTLDAQVARSKAAMAGGADVVYQAALRDGPLAGYADFLERVDTPSDFGPFGYEVVDTKLSRSPKAKFLIQLAFYSDILGKLQGRRPEAMHVVLGNGQRLSYRVADYIRYYATTRHRYLSALEDGFRNTYPEPCTKCAQCAWIDRCEEQWTRDDHLSRVANIRTSQIRKLNDAGIHTLEALATLESCATIPKLASETLSVLRHQAELQLRARQTGEKAFDLLPIHDGEQRGFLRLPTPDPHDLYFDMEGDPLETDGLEYLFGVGYRQADEFVFKPFWAHSRDEEKLAFEQFVDFVTNHIARHPAAHIYHYATYEETALKRLMSLHGTREKEVDNLLRTGRLIDLYKVVREAVRVSEPKYSIKNIERFFRQQRGGDVQNAGASIVFYERWKQTQDKALLADIEAYNRDDVESTEGLHAWLRSIRPETLAWRANNASSTDSNGAATIDMEDDSTTLKARLLTMANQHGSALPDEAAFRLLTSQLIDFHRREQKPQWWKMFECLQMDTQALIEDAECIGGMHLDPTIPPYAVKQSLVYTYRYPEQETKLRAGSNATRLDSGKPITLYDVDHERRTVALKIGKKADPLPSALSIGAGAPLSDKLLRARIRLFAESVLTNDGGFAAVKGLLAKDLPSVRGIALGNPLVNEGSTVTDIAKIVACLQASHLVIQGPPGAGKTYTGSHVIVELIRRGFSVGVASNSHKAIHNLLGAVVDVAEHSGVNFRGFKKMTADNEDTIFAASCFDNGNTVQEFDPKRHQLFAGTAWAFATLPPDAPLDYLFIDEAGQVSLGNLVAMGVSARNIVLLGDQMQLAQPIQGTHPGRSGESALDYLLDGRPTIPPAAGVFLAKTWRMHPLICDFISDAVYDGKLRAAGKAATRRLELTHDAPPELAPAGIGFVPVIHTGRSQCSPEEGVAVKELYEALLEQPFIGDDAKQRLLSSEDILVVSPYNVQVNYLKRTLPPGARIGTVDKFQGQEAAVVIISMATSSGDELPRDIEFLYSKNRLNVAISRAKCLALVVCSPDLLSVRCNTPEQMALVNTLCWVKDYSESQASKMCDVAGPRDAQESFLSDTTKPASVGRR